MEGVSYSLNHYVNHNKARLFESNFFWRGINLTPQIYPTPVSLFRIKTKSEGNSDFLWVILMKYWMFMLPNNIKNICMAKILKFTWNRVEMMRSHNKSINM